jgi:hypothetical protein
VTVTTGPSQLAPAITPADEQCYGFRSAPRLHNLCFRCHAMVRIFEPVAATVARATSPSIEAIAEAEWGDRANRAHARLPRPQVQPGTLLGKRRRYSRGRQPMARRFGSRFMGSNKKPGIFFRAFPKQGHFTEAGSPWLPHSPWDRPSSTTTNGHLHIRIETDGQAGRFWQARNCHQGTGERPRCFGGAPWMSSSAVSVDRRLSRSSSGGDRIPP